MGAAKSKYAEVKLDENSSNVPSRPKESGSVDNGGRKKLKFWGRNKKNHTRAAGQQQQQQPPRRQQQIQQQQTQGRKYAPSAVGAIAGPIGNIALTHKNPSRIIPSGVRGRTAMLEKAGGADVPGSSSSPAAAGIHGATLPGSGRGAPVSTLGPLTKNIAALHIPTSKQEDSAQTLSASRRGRKSVPTPTEISPIDKRTKSPSCSDVNGGALPVLQPPPSTPNRHRTKPVASLPPSLKNAGVAASNWDASRPSQKKHRHHKHKSDKSLDLKHQHRNEQKDSSHPYPQIISTSPYVEDYYTEMIAETTSSKRSNHDKKTHHHKPSTKHNHKSNSSPNNSHTSMSSSSFSTTTNDSKSDSGDENRAFEAMLSSGMVWADIPRGGKITCLALSPAPPSPPLNVHVRHPLFLAIGTDDGFVAVMEILDDGSAASSSSVDLLGGGGSIAGLSLNSSVDGTSASSHRRSGGSGRHATGLKKRKKYGSVRELPREGKVRSLDFSPDGKLLAVGGDDCTAAIIDVGLDEAAKVEYDEYGARTDIYTSGNKALPPLRVIKELEREDRVYTTRFSPCGTMLAVGGFDGMVAIASIFAEGEKRTEDHETEGLMELIVEIPRLGLILSVDWSPDGKLLVIGGSDKRAAVVDVHGTCSRSILGDVDDMSTVSSVAAWEVVGEIQRAASVQCVRWSPDGTHLAIGGHDGLIAVVDISSRSIVKEVLRTLNTGGNCRISGLCWSPDGMFLAIGGNDDACAIIEMKTFVVVHEIRRSGHVNCVHWGYQFPGGGAAGGRYLAVGGDDRAVAILKTDSDNDAVSQCSNKENDDQSSINSADSSIQNEWKFEEGSFRDMEEDIGMVGDSPEDKISINAVVFSKTDEEEGISQYMAVSGSDCRVTVFSAEDWIVITEMQFPKPIYDLMFSNDNEYLALGGENNVIYVISVQTWEIANETTTSSSILTLGFSAKDERLALGLIDGTLSLLDTSSNANWRIAGEMDTSDCPILTLDWSSDGLHLAVGRNDATVSVHQSQNVFGNFFVPEAELHRPGGAPIHTVAFGVGGKFLAVGGGDWTVAIYSSKGGWVQCHQLKLTGWIMSASWSPNGRYLAVGGSDAKKGGTVYDTISWDQVEEIGRDSAPSGIGIGEEVTTIDWSDDGRWLVVAGKGGISRVVDTYNWEVAHSLDHHDYHDIETLDETCADREDMTIRTENSGARSSIRKILSSSQEFEESEKSPQFLSKPKTNEFAEAYVGTPQNLLLEDADDISAKGGGENRSVDEDCFSDDRHTDEGMRIDKIVDSGASNNGVPADFTPWDHIPTVNRFIVVCEEFLEPYEQGETPDVLRLFVPSILMLQLHVKWLSTTDPADLYAVELKDCGQLEAALLSVLDQATMAMERVMDEGDDLEEWWNESTKFELSILHERRIDVWNQYWQRLDDNAPLVDTNLLSVADS